MLWYQKLMKKLVFRRGTTPKLISACRGDCTFRNFYAFWRAAHRRRPFAAGAQQDHSVRARCASAARRAPSPWSGRVRTYKVSAAPGALSARSQPARVALSRSYRRRRAPVAPACACRTPSPDPAPGSDGARTAPSPRVFHVSGTKTGNTRVLYHTCSSPS